MVQDSQDTAQILSDFYPELKSLNFVARGNWKKSTYKVPTIQGITNRYIRYSSAVQRSFRRVYLGGCIHQVYSIKLWD